jgi:hypothetical protein
MVLYTAGQRIRGSEINALPQLYRTTGDQSNNTVSYSNVNGLSFPADINGWYLIECFLFYKANINPGDLMVRWQFPAATSGWWAADGVASDQAGGSVGTVNRQSVLFNTPGEHAFNGGDGIDVFAKPAATIQLGANAGTVQLQYRQLTVNSGNPTTIRAGSAIRVSRLA